MKYLRAHLVNYQIKAVKSRIVFRTHTNIYDEAFLVNNLLFSQKTPL